MHRITDLFIGLILMLLAHYVVDAPSSVMHAMSTTEGAIAEEPLSDGISCKILCIVNCRMCVGCRL